MGLNRYKQYTFDDEIWQSIIDENHELAKLAEFLPWEDIFEALRPYYSRLGREAKSIRLMVGLHIMKHRFSLSDVDTVRNFHENYYWQYLCNISLDVFLKKGPKKLIADSTMCKFRKRLGAEGLKVLEDTIKNVLIKEGRINKRVQLVDTTVIEKNIIYPTDSSLLQKGRTKIVKIMKKLKVLGVKGIEKVRSFKNKSRKIIIGINKLGKGRKERIAKGTLELAEYAKTVIKKVPEIIKNTDNTIRCLRRKSEEKLVNTAKRIKQELKETVKIVEKVIEQSVERIENNIHIPGKIFSIHEPEVTGIKKGKRGKGTEYGSKICLSTDVNGFVVSHQEYNTNIYDGKTLSAALRGWKDSTGTSAHDLGCDRGFSETIEDRKVYGIGNIKNVSIPKRGKKKAEKESSHTFKRIQKKRSAQEAVIGHLKRYGLGKSYYKGTEGDSISASSAIMVWNLKKVIGF